MGKGNMSLCCTGVTQAKNLKNINFIILVDF